MKTLQFHGNRIVEGENALEVLASLSFCRAMIVTGGSSMARTGVLARVQALLAGEGREMTVYSGVGKNPTTLEVERGVAAMRAFGPDLVVAVGGGSAIDLAKIVTMIYEYPELDIHSLPGQPIPASRSRTTFVAIPSTSGTATEVTHVSVITYPDRSLKIGLKSPAMRPDLAILDGTIPMTMPADIAAQTGMDALTHALESLINHTGDDFTDGLAQVAAEGIFRWLPISCEEATLESRQKMHNYQCIAGMSFSNAGLGAVHGMSHAFGGRYDLPHGLTNAILLPYVMEYNRRDEATAQKLDRMALLVGCDDFVAAIRALNDRLGIPRTIALAGVSEADFIKDFKLLTDNALLGSTRVNPVKVPREDMEKLLRAVYYGLPIDF